MNALASGFVAGLVFGIVGVLLMIPMEVEDKATAMAGAFFSRLAIGFLIPLALGHPATMFRCRNERRFAGCPPADSRASSISRRSLRAVLQLRIVSCRYSDVPTILVNLLCVAFSGLTSLMTAP